MVKKALVVDDDESWCKLGSYKLKKEGYEVTTATTLSEAEEAVKREKFHLVRTDWNLQEGKPVYADGIARLAIQRGAKIEILTGTDDTSGKLVRLQKDFPDIEIRNKGERR